MQPNYTYIYGKTSYIMSSEKLKEQIQIKLESRIEGALKEFHGEIDKKVRKAIISASKDLSKKLVKSIEKASKKAKSTVIIINKTDKKLPIPALAAEASTTPKVSRSKSRVATTATKSIDHSATRPKSASIKPKIAPVADTEPTISTRKKPGPKPKAIPTIEASPLKRSTTRAPRKKNS